MSVGHELINNWLEPNYKEAIYQRGQIVDYILTKPAALRAAKKYYATNPVDFINHHLWTLDPRKEKNRKMPFILFPRQEDYIWWLYDCYMSRKNGVVMKSRDMGASWLNCAFAVSVFLFCPDSSVTMGSRKEMQVDRLGDLDSLMEKCRYLLRTMPWWLLPAGFDEAKHMGYLKITNPENGSMIKGEAGDNIGRGGRSSLFILDEAAFIERPMVVEAAISQNSDCIIYTSTPKGSHDWFYKKWDRGEINKFRFRWQEDPRKNQAWYDKQKRELDPVILATEIDADMTISFENVCIAGNHIQAAVDLKIEGIGKIIAGFDVADEGRDKHSLYIRQGGAYVYMEEWQLGDVSQATQKAFQICERYKVDVINYDAIGVGAGAKAEFNKLKARAKETGGYAPQINGIHIGTRDLKGFYAEGKKNRDMFYNLKSQWWWALREKFHKTYDYVQNGNIGNTDDLISIPYDMDLLDQLAQQQYEFKDTGLIIMKPKKDLYAKSPNKADALVLSFCSTGYTERELFII